MIACWFPSDAGLAAKGFGLELTGKCKWIERGFVVVDKQQRTADPHIRGDR